MEQLTEYLSANRKVYLEKLRVPGQCGPLPQTRWTVLLRDDINIDFSCPHTYVNRCKHTYTKFSTGFIKCTISCM